MAEILITVTPDGTTQITVVGHAGPGCLALTSSLEAALGEVESQEYTSEYYEEAEEVKQCLNTM